MMKHQNDYRSDPTSTGACSSNSKRLQEHQPQGAKKIKVGSDDVKDHPHSKVSSILGKRQCESHQQQTMTRDQLRRRLTAQMEVERQQALSTIQPPAYRPAKRPRDNNDEPSFAPAYSRLKHPG